MHIGTYAYRPCVSHLKLRQSNYSESVISTSTLDVTAQESTPRTGESGKFSVPRSSVLHLDFRSSIISTLDHFTLYCHVLVALSVLLSMYCIIPLSSARSLRAPHRMALSSARSLQAPHDMTWSLISTLHGAPMSCGARRDLALESASHPQPSRGNRRIDARDLNEIACLLTYRDE